MEFNLEYIDDRNKETNQILTMYDYQLKSYNKMRTARSDVTATVAIRECS